MAPFLAGARLLRALRVAPTRDMIYSALATITLRVFQANSRYHYVIVIIIGLFQRHRTKDPSSRFLGVQGAGVSTTNWIPALWKPHPQTADTSRESSAAQAAWTRAFPSSEHRHSLPNPPKFQPSCRAAARVRCIIDRDWCRPSQTQSAEPRGLASLGSHGPLALAWWWAPVPANVTGA